jgi:hypothetical protein
MTVAYVYGLSRKRCGPYGKCPNIVPFCGHSEWMYGEEVGVGMGGAQCIDPALQP